jgi:hypothetical protein
MKECDNLLINQYQNQGKVFTRPGSELYDKTAARPVANRISTCFEYKGNLYVQSVDKLYYYYSETITANALVVNEIYQITSLGDTNFVLLGAKSNTLGAYFKANATGTGVGTGSCRKGFWAEIPGQNGNKAFPGSGAEHQFTYDHWNNHTIMANSTLPGYPMKVYQVGDEIKLTQSIYTLICACIIFFMFQSFSLNGISQISIKINQYITTVSLNDTQLVILEIDSMKKQIKIIYLNKDIINQKIISNFSYIIQQSGWSIVDSQQNTQKQINMYEKQIGILYKKMLELQQPQP